MSLSARASISLVAVALGILAAWQAGPFGAIFFIPALAVAGVFGGLVLGLIALAATIVAIHTLFPAEPVLLLDAGAALQTALALLGRMLFRESRRWGVRHRRLLSTISIATTISDADGNIERPHPDLGRLIGMDWPDYRGQGWTTAIHPDDLARMVPRTPAHDGQPQRHEIRVRDAATGGWHWYLMRASPLFDDNGRVVEWISALTDIQDSKQVEEHQHMVIGEARHRLKNLITLIESLAKSSKSGSGDSVETFLRKFSGRLHALSAAGDLALASNYSTIDTHEIVKATLAPFLETESSRLSFGGPTLKLSEATGGALALGVHELATNAIKYGALSVPNGRVAFNWRIEDNDGGNQRVVMEWIEHGRPNATPPTREGFGGRLIRFIPNREKNGDVDVAHTEDGYRCRVSFTRTPRAG